jgi:hypothetical protein
MQPTTANEQYFININADGISIRTSGKCSADFMLASIKQKPLLKKCFNAYKNKTSITFTEEEMQYIIDNKENAKFKIGQIVEINCDTYHIRGEAMCIEEIEINGGGWPIDRIGFFYYFKLEGEFIGFFEEDLIEIDNTPKQ